MSNNGFQPVLQSSVPHLGTIELYIETLTGTAFEMNVSPFETIISIKSKIQRVEGIPVSHQHLIYNSQELEDNSCLMDYSIHDGTTLKLVLAMKGGPINTRRVTMYDDTTWREMQELMELNREELFERLPTGGHVTLLVFRDGDQINFYRVIEKEDGTFSPLSESWSGSSIRNLFAEDDDEEIEKRIKENAMTMGKMQELRQKMENMSVKKRPKRVSCVSSGGHPVSCNGGHFSFHTRQVKVKTPPSRSFKLPPVNSRRKQSEGNSLQEFVGQEKFRSKSTLKLTDNSIMLRETVFQQSRTSILPGRKNRFSRHSQDWCGKSSLGSQKKMPNTGCSNTTTVIHQDLFSDKNESVTFGQKITADVSSLTESPEYKGRNYSAYRKSLHRAGRGHLKSSASAKQTVKVKENDRHVTEYVKTIVAENSCTVDDKHKHSFPIRREMQDCSYSKKLPHVRESDESGPRALSRQFDIGVSERPKTSPVNFTGGRNNIPSPTMSTISEKLHLSQSDQRAYEICEILSHRKAKNQSQDSPPLSRRSHSKELIILEENEKLDADKNENITLDKNSRTSSHSKDLNDILLEPRLWNRSPIERNFSQNSVRLGLGELVVGGNKETQDVYHDLMKTPNSQTSHYSDQKLEARLQRRLSASRQGRLNSAHKMSNVTKKKSCRNRCSECNKKIGITATYSCHCGKLFCATHRYAEVHHCTFDYKSEGRKMLEQANPLITASKLPKI